MGTEVLSGTKRTFESLDAPVEILTEKRNKVAKLVADPEWSKEEAAEYEKDNEEFTPKEEAADDYYEDEIKEVEASEFDDESMSAIKTLAKDYIVDVFENARLIAKRIGKRDVVTEEDMQVAVEIMQRSAARAAKPEQVAET